jgi:peptidoglycan/xylan/chitin deacetylase (PgdA/CDA1 family)
MRRFPSLALAMVLALTGAGTVVPAHAAAEKRATATAARPAAAEAADQARVDCRRVKCVALTFDDGPGDHTGVLLDMLAASDARATFFVLGSRVLEDDAGHLRRMVEEGHELGNHSFDHPDLTALSREGIREQLVQTQEVVRWRTGVEMRLMRPPYGATDGRVADVTRDAGLAQIMWDVDTFDWRHRRPAQTVRLGEQAVPGSIVLMHDIHESTVAAVPELVDRLSEQGYALVTVSELFGDRSLRPGNRYSDARPRNRVDR